MRLPLIKIAWGCILASLLAGYAAVLGWLGGWQFAWTLAAVSLVAGPVGAGYLMLRYGLFLKRLSELLRRLIAGDYETGIREGRLRRDELGRIEKMLNTLSDDLRIIDALRADRVRVSGRTLDAVLEGCTQALMIVERDRGTLEMNPAACRLFGVDQPSVSLQALDGVPGNRPFLQLLHRAMEVERLPLGGRVAVRLVPRDSGLDLDLRVVPIKNKDERVLRAVIFIRLPASAG